MKITVENIINEKQDREIIKAFEKMFMLYPEDDLYTIKPLIREVKFNNHLVGCGGSHIWIKNKSNINKRVAIITE